MNTLEDEKQINNCKIIEKTFDRKEVIMPITDLNLPEKDFKSFIWLPFQIPLLASG